jgi:hypothetical protein
MAYGREGIVFLGAVWWANAQSGGNSMKNLWIGAIVTNNELESFSD